MKTLALISSNSLLSDALFFLLSSHFLVQKFSNMPNDAHFYWIIFDEPTQNDIKKIHHTAEHVLCLSQKNIPHPPYIRMLQKPFQYSALLESLTQENVLKLSINNFVFFPTLRILQDKNALSTSLTEKEAEILYVLCLQTTPISREVLLKEIWNYQPYITTHTLETHIYRLRKKLNDHDSSLLKTHDNGYMLISS